MSPLRTMAGLALLLFSRLVWAQTMETQVQVEVFVSDRESLSDVAQYPSVAVLNIETASRLMQELNHDLPGDPQLASALAQLRLTDAFKDSLDYAMGALLRAKAYRITKVPSVVINGQWVIEGPGTLANALQIYRQWSLSHAH